MTTPIIAEKRYTAEEFWEFAEMPENEHKRLELDDGEIVEMAGSKPVNTITGGRILYFLNVYVIPRDFGYVTGADGEFKLAPKIVRVPDVAFVAKERVEKLPRRFNFAPDLAVEIISPREDALKKVYEYLRAGTKLVWAVYPEDQEVHVFRFDAEGNLRGRTFGMNNILDEGAVLPDFQLPVKDIFPE
jgi:Uma2 family endonuclease